jgi:hypothetical protein
MVSSISRAGSQLITGKLADYQAGSPRFCLVLNQIFRGSAPLRSSRQAPFGSGWTANLEVGPWQFGETAMTIKAIARLTFIALTGTLIIAATPASAACTGDNCNSEKAGKPVNLKHFATKKIRIAHLHHRGAGRVDDTDRPTKVDRLSADVADANAQMIADETRARAAAPEQPAPPAQAQAAVSKSAATNEPDISVQIVNADELNDVDRAATDETAPLPKLPPSIANSRAEFRDDRSPWSQTSTIGKAFIAFGVMLTLASAARMFMA